MKRYLGPVGLYRLSALIRRFAILRLLSRLIDYANRILFSCWIPGSVNIGNDLVLGYWGLSIVIHSSCDIGDRVHIDQCVTIGGNGVEPGVPKLESDIYIGAGAKVLGPITVGAGSIIGANAVVLQNVAPGTVVAGVPAREIQSGIDLDKYLYRPEKTA